MPVQFASTVCITDYCTISEMVIISNNHTLLALYTNYEQIMNIAYEHF